MRVEITRGKDEGNQNTKSVQRHVQEAPKRRKERSEGNMPVENQRTYKTGKGRMKKSKAEKGFKRMLQIQGNICPVFMFIQHFVRSSTPLKPRM